MSIHISDQVIRHHFPEFDFKIQNARTARDESVLDERDGLHHEEPFLLAIDGLPPFQVEDRLVGSKRDIHISILCSLAEEFNVAAVQHVKAAADKYFLSHR